MQPINIINGSWKQGVEPKVVNLTGTAFMEEAGAHVFHISAEDASGAAIAFTGTVSALFLRADNTTVAIDGEISEGAAEITLVSDCYHVPGRFSIAVYVSDGTDSACVYAAVGNVYRTSSDVVIDSGATIPTLAQLQAAYQACVEATAAAEGAAEEAIGNFAPAFAEATANVAGSYVTYTDGKMYLLPNGHTANTTWANTTKSEVKVGGELTDLKGAAAEVKKKVNRSSVTADRTISGTGQVEFPDALDEPMSLNLKLEPKQDLHGYDKPWVGGSGKNLCPTPSANSGTVRGIDFTVHDNGSITISGTSTAATGVAFSKPFSVKSGVQYILSGCPTNGSSESYRLDLRTNETTLYRPDGTNEVIDYGSEIGFTPSSDATIMVAVRVASGYTVPSDGITLYPMLRLATETDPTYEPYSNICPITGYDAVEVVSTGKNLLDDSGSGDYVAILPAGTYAIKRFNLSTDTQVNSRIELLIDNSYTYIIGGEYDNGNVVVIRGDLGWGNSPSQIIQTKKAYSMRLLGTTKNALKVHSATLMMVPGSIVPTEYMPYTGYNFLSLNLTSAAGGTVYGGTVTVNEDGSGELVVDRAKVLFSGMSWAVNGTYANTYNIVLPSSYPRHAVSDAELSKSLSNKYLWYASSTVANNDYGFAMSINNDLQFYVKDKDIATAEEANAKFNDLEISYPLHYPVTYPLTASQINSLLGYTQVITDTDGALTVGYKTDKYAKLEKFLAAMPSDTVTGDPAVFTDGADGLPMKKLMVDIQPKQDLHGYDKPWVGGNGKNLLPATLEGIKAANTTGTWNGNSYNTGSGITITVLTDSDNNILGYSASGTATATVAFTTSESMVGLFAQGTELGYNGCTGGSISTYKTDIYVQSSRVYTPVTCYDGNINLTINDEIVGASKFYSRIVIYSGYVANNLMFYPMLRLSSVVSTAYEPYSNICPISGWDEVNVTRVGKNLLEGIYSGGISNTTGQDETATNGVSDYIVVSSQTSYTLSGSTIGNNMVRYFEYDKYKNFIGTNTASASNNAATMTVGSNTRYLRIKGSNTVLVPGGVYMLEKGSAATAYEPYNPATLSVNVKSLTGSTVYGGTLTVNADGTGTLVVDRAIQSVNGLSFSNVQSSSLEAKVYISASLSKAILGGSTFVCDKLEGYSFQTRGNKWSCSPLSAIDSTGFAVFAEEGATKNDILDKIADANICYVLATPVTYPLTATQLETLLGANTVWCDAGEVTVEYCVDLEKYIEKRSSDDEHFPGDGKLVAGTNTQATRNNAVATGNRTTASGANSHAEGNGTTASGQDSHAEGQNTTASQGSAHAEGMSTTASGYSGAHAEGAGTEASGQTSHAEGYKAKAQGKYSHAQGNETTASGESSHAEGDKTVASGKGAHAEGQDTKATVPNSHAEGGGTTASGQNSHAEGGATTASAQNSHAEGGGTTASGTQSHAEGAGAMATGQNSHAEGTGTIANSMSSHAEGTNTLAYGKSQHVFGEFNVQDGDTNTVSTRATYVEIVGNGTVNARSNARTLDWNGNEALAGSLTLGMGSADEVTLTAAQLKALLALLP